MKNEIVAHYTHRYCRNFHILDSLPFDNPAVKEVKQLQFILLQYFKEESYKEGRIVVNVAKVSHINTSKIWLFIYYLGASPKEYK